MINHAADITDTHLLGHVSHAYQSLLEVCMQTIGLRRAQIRLLMQLHEQDGIAQIELADQLSMNGATVSEMLLRLEEINLIIRRRDTVDRRLVRVYLTDAGREKWLDTQDQFQNLEKAVFEGVQPEQRPMLRRLLHQLLNNMSKTARDCPMHG